MRCCVPNCSNDTKRRTKTQGITFHMIPRERNLRQSWLEALSMPVWEPKDRSTVCSEHFRNEDFYETKCGLRKIKSGAIPVLGLGSDDLDAPAGSRVCRICMTTNMKMYDTREYQLGIVYQQITGIEWSEKDNLPQKLCWECAGRIVSCSRLRTRALKSHQLMMNMLNTASYLKIKDVKSVSRSHMEIHTSLIQKILEPNECDMYFQDTSEPVFLHEEPEAHDDDGIKAESPDRSIGECPASPLPSDNPEIHIQPMINIEVEVKNEQQDEIYFNEYNDHFESDDNIKLSEVASEVVEKPKVKVKRKKIKVEKKKVKARKKEKKTEEGEKGEDPNETMDKYKTSDVKRRKTSDGLDESLFIISALSYEEQIAEIQKRQESSAYKTAPYKCNVCYRGFLVGERYNAHVIRHSDILDTKVKRRKTSDGLDESLFIISALSYEEQIAEIQKRQESSANKTAPYKCNVCYRRFLVGERYNAHVIRHSDQSGAFECFICKTRLKTGRALRKHLTAQHTEKFSCKGCPFVTRNRGVAREHEKWHAGAKYQCPHCPSEFDKLTTYMGHIRIKHVSDFVCELCGFTFVSKKGIEVHKKKKHRLSEKTVCLEGPYCCVCDVTFVSEEAHARHLKLSSRHSSDNDPNRIRNDSQSINTSHSGRIVRKIERRPVVHARDPAERERRPGAGGPVTCEQCGIQLRDLRLYAQHFRRAHPDKNRTKYPAMKTPCMCEQCGRIFQSMALLKDHMWVHTGEKRFKCDRCEKSFTQKTNLVFHMRVHSATRPTYECPLCGKHFAFFNNRRRHMFIHTGLKPFKCETCSKCFTTAGEQRAHVEHVHLKKPWPKRARGQRRENAPWQKNGLDHED